MVRTEDVIVAVTFDLTEKALLVKINEIVVYEFEKKNYSGGSGYILHSSNDMPINILKQLSKLKLQDIPHGVNFFSVSEEFDKEIATKTNVFISSENEKYCLSYNYYFSHRSWKLPFNIFDFLDVYITELNKCNFNASYDDDIDISLYIDIPLDKMKEKTIQTLLDDALLEINDCLNKSIDIILNHNSNNVLSFLFDFPPEYKNICSQYLIWFGEFLKNLGVEANVSTKQEHGRTALIISPEENGELLTKIKELFYRYIDLPYMEYIPYNADNMNSSQKYKMDSLLDEVGDYQHKLKKAMRHQRLLEAENDGLLEDKIKLKTNVKELEKDKLLLKSCLKDPKKSEIFSCLNKSFSIVSSVDTKNDLTVGLGIEIKPKGMIKEMFKGKDKSDNKTSEDNE